MKDIWYYVQEDQRMGPVTPLELQKLAASNIISPSTLVWRKGLKNWSPAAQVKGLFGNFPPKSNPEPVKQPDCSGPSTSGRRIISGNPSLPTPQNAALKEYPTKLRFKKTWAIGLGFIMMAAFSFFRIYVVHTNITSDTPQEGGGTLEDLSTEAPTVREPYAIKTESKNTDCSSQVMADQKESGKPDAQHASGSKTTNSKTEIKSSTSPTSNNKPITRSQRKTMAAFAKSENQGAFKDGFTDGFKNGKLLVDNHLLFENMPKDARERIEKGTIASHNKESLASMRKWRAFHEKPVKEYMSLDEAARSRNSGFGCYKIGFLDGYMTIIESKNIVLD